MKKIPVKVTIHPNTGSTRYGQVDIGDARYVASVSDHSALMWAHDGIKGPNPGFRVHAYSDGFKSMSDAVDWVVDQIPVINSRRDLLAFQFIGG